MAVTPKRVEAVGLFALIAAGGLGFPFLISLMARQLLFNSPLIAVVATFSYGAFVVAGLILFVIFFGRLSPSKNIWYTTVAYWVLLLTFSLVYDITNLGTLERTASQFFLAQVFVPYFCSTACIVFLATHQARQYFHVTRL